MRPRIAFGVLRLVTAAVCLIALVHRLFWGLSSQTIAGRNFLAYLTVESNIALVVILVFGGILAFGRAADPRWFSVAQVLHFWLPAFTAIAWTLTPGHRAVPWWIVPGCLVFPLVWGGVTMWRGPLIGWYPYYFLDLRQVSGFGEFALTSGIALSIFALIAALLALISRISPAKADATASRRAKKISPRQPAGTASAT